MRSCTGDLIGSLQLSRTIFFTSFCGRVRSPRSPRCTLHRLDILVRLMTLFLVAQEHRLVVLGRTFRKTPFRANVSAGEGAYSCVAYFSHH